MATPLRSPVTGASWRFLDKWSQQKMKSQRLQRDQLSNGKYAAFNRSTHLQGVVRRTYASFVNRSTETLKFIWLDFDGNAQQYRAVRPGRKFHVYTFNTHQWVVEDSSGRIWASHVYGATLEVSHTCIPICQCVMRYV